MKIDLQTSAQRTLCQRSFFDFIKTFWSAVIQEEPIYNWHIEYLAGELQQIGERVARREPKEHDYVIINISPGSSKSTIASIMYPIWAWTIDPTQRFICASYAEDIALDLANKTTRILNSDLFKRLFPELAPTRQSLSHIENRYGGERYTAATGSAVTGKHAHQIIIDDPLNPKKAASDIELKAANEFVSTTMSTRKVNKTITPTLIIMQRLHEMDTTGYLLAKQADGLKVRHICIPGELSDRVQPTHLRENYVDGLFDPVRLDYSVLDSMRLELGSYGYAGQVGQNPAPEGGGIMKKDWFEVVDRQIPRHCTIRFRLDTAYTDKQRNDPSGFLAYYVDEGVLYLTNFETVRMEMPELLKYIPTYVNRQGYTQRSVIKVEPKASGKSVVQVLKLLPWLNIMEGPVPKDDKETRAKAASPKVEAGKVKLHRGVWNDQFLHEVSTFPNAQHDEAMDLLCEAIQEELIVNMSEYGFKRLARR